MRCGRTICRDLYVVAVTIGLLAWAGPAGAAITTTGSIDPSYDSTDPWVLLTDLLVGKDADASIVVSGGSQVQTGSAFSGQYGTVIAADPNVTASVTVTGENSAWETTVFVGHYGDGTMVVEDGARLTAGGIWVGREPNSIGSLTLTGPGTTWVGLPDEKVSILDTEYPVVPDETDRQQYVYASIGSEGTGSLTVSDGARVVSDSGRLYLGYLSDGVGSLTVTGPNSVWQETGPVRVGYHGQGTLVISDGGAMTTTDTVHIGNSSIGASRGSVTVTDPNSLWHIAEGILVGGGGHGELLIANGGRIESDHGSIDSPGSTADPSSATVTGAGSLWQNAGYVTVGNDGPAELTIADGGQVTNTDAYVGYNSGGDGVVSVTDANSMWANSGQLHVGYRGDGTVSVTNGGRLTSDTGIIGTRATSEGWVFVDGAGSQWANSGELQAGVAGTGYLYVEDGGRLTSTTAVVGVESTGVGTVRLAGQDSRWENSGDFHFGQAGRGTLVLDAGTRAVGHSAFLGVQAGSRGDIGMVQSVLELSGPLYVGVAGEGDFNVTYGSHAVSEGAVLASETGSEAVVQVLQPTSLWEAGDYLDVGYAGDAVMLVGQRGRVTNTVGRVAVAPGSTGRVTVEGNVNTSAFWENATDLYVGYGGAGQMAIVEGGTVTCRDGYIAYLAGSTGTVTVAGVNSLWSVADQLDVGGAGDANMVISNGGRVTSGMSNVTGVVRVMGTGSTWDGGEGLAVAEGGDVTVSGGGHVVADMSYIGGDSGIASRVVVTGAGSQWDSGTSLLPGFPSLIVGAEGDASLLIADGGRVTAPDAWVKAEGDGTALVTVTGTDSRWTIADRLEVGDIPRLFWIGPRHQLAYGTVVARDDGVVEADEIVVYEGSILTGDGTFQAGLTTNDGIIRPGNSIGTLTFDGDLTHDANGVLEIEIDNDGNSDKLLVTGTFTQNSGRYQPIPTEVISGTHDYQIVEANDVVWPVLAVLTPYNTAFLNSYTTETFGPEPNGVAMHVTALPFDDPSVAQTSTQRSFGAAVNEMAEDPNNALPLLLQRLDTAAEARTAYDQLSGSTRGPLGAVTVAAGARPMRIVSGRMRDAAAGQPSGTGATMSVETGTSRYSFALGHGTPYLSDRQWGVWGKWYGLYGDRETDGAEPGYQYSTFGAGFGLDYQISDTTLLGVTGGYWDGDVDFASSADSTVLTGAYLGFYGSYARPKWYLDAIVTYASLDYQTERVVDLFGERLEGDFGGDMFSGYLEAGLNWWRRADCLVQPLASLQVSYLDIDGYTESAGTASLRYEGEQYQSYRGGLGLKAVRQLFGHADGAKAEIELRGRWVHEFGDTQSSVDASFAGDPTAVFRISDAEISRDSAVLGAGLNARLGQATRVYFDYDTELNPDRNVQVFSAGFEYRW